MARRQRIDTGTDKRAARRDERGRFVASKKRWGGRGRTAVARTSSLRNVPVELLVAMAAGLVVITAGAVITSVTLRRGGTGFRT
jgi:hypothetical protein